MNNIKSVFEKFRNRKGFILILSGIGLFVFAISFFIFTLVLGAVFGEENEDFFFTLFMVGSGGSLFIGILSFIIGLIMFFTNKSIGEINSGFMSSAKTLSNNIAEISQIISPDLSVEQRKNILQIEINKYVRTGFRVVSQTDTTAQLVKPKSFSCFWFLVNMVLLIGWIFYLAWYLAKRDEQIYIEVDIKGKIHTKH